MNQDDEKTRGFQEESRHRYAVTRAGGALAVQETAAEPFGGLLSLNLLERNLAAAMDAMPSGLLIVDSGGVVVLANAMAEQLVGNMGRYTPRRHIGEVLYTPLDHELRETSELLREAFVSGRPIHRVAVHVTTPAGDAQEVDYEIVSIVDDGGALIGGLFILEVVGSTDAVSPRTV